MTNTMPTDSKLDDDSTRTMLHADTGTRQSVPNASRTAAGCYATAQHNRRAALSAANTMADHQLEAEQAAQLHRPSTHLCGCSRSDSRLRAASCAAAAQEAAGQAVSNAPHKVKVHPPRPQAAPCNCTPTRLRSIVAAQRMAQPSCRRRVRSTCVRERVGCGLRRAPPRRLGPRSNPRE